MSPVEALRRPLQEDLSGFVALLRRLQVPHRVSEERGAQVLWVPSQPLAEQVRALYLSYPQGAAEEQIPTPARPSRPGLVRATAGQLDDHAGAVADPGRRRRDFAR